MRSVPTGYEVTRPTLLHSTFCILEFDHVGSPVVLSQTETVLRVGTVAPRICSTHILNSVDTVSFDLIRCYKIIFGLVCVNADDFF